MRYLKMMGLGAVAAATLMAATGTASATLTDGSGKEMSSLHASNSGNMVLTGSSLTVTCSESTVAGNVKAPQGATHVESNGELTTLTLNGCNHTVTVAKSGTLTATATGTNTATVYSTGAEVTVLAHNFLLGTVHCTYVTDETDIGTLTGSGHKGNPNTTAKIDISATIPIDEETSDDICGEGAATWEGTYLVSSPDHVIVDAVTLTDGSGNSPSTVHASNSANLFLTGMSITNSCTSSTLSGNVTTNDLSHAEVLLTSLTYGGCNHTVTVVDEGTLTIIDTGTNTATVRWDGAEITWLTHFFIIGTRHCTFVTSETDIGTLTGTGHANNPNTTAQLDINATIPINGATSHEPCGSASVWEGSYLVSTPDHLTID